MTIIVQIIIVGQVIGFRFLERFKCVPRRQKSASNMLTRRSADRRQTVHLHYWHDSCNISPLITIQVENNDNVPLKMI